MAVAQDAATTSPPPWVNAAVAALSLALFCFILATAVAGEFSTDIQRGVPFAVIVAIVLLRHPLAPGARWLRLVDLVLMAGAVYAVGYVAAYGDLIVGRLGRLNPQDIAASLIGLAVPALGELFRSHPLSFSSSGSY